tara:strand:+ start:808 stop:1992 length:1185 start_codon:yes stop_codon:yes gene_type:complete
MIRIIFLFLLLTFYSCSKKNDISPELYVGFLKSNDSINIPFNFNLNDSLMFITNSNEKINLSISNDNDSIKAQSPFFEDFLMFVILKDSISGFYYNKSLQRKIPFFAKPGKNRFLFKKMYSDFDGKWKVVFNYNTTSSFNSEMIISQSKNDISGTVRTETGDYGFMEGVVSDNKMSMSNFNGYRGYMIEGYLKGDTIKGNLYRGNYDVKNFIAYKDESFKLPDPYELTKMKNGIEKFNFSFKNEFGELISSSDNKFIGKINLIQIMGSWCPNCLDESRFLLELSKKYNNINVTAIAFEFANSEEKAINNIKKLKNSLGIDYDILLAQYNSSNKIDAAQKLSSLDTLISYPTLIVVDKKQKVRRIHTGFNGPATGENYDLFKKEFEDFLQKLILE